MMPHLRRAAFDAQDLVRIDPPRRPVVLRSGGPVMDLESADDGGGLCRWEDEAGRVCRAVIPVECLYACSPLTEPA